MCLVLCQLRIGITHFPDQGCDQFIEKRFLHTQLVAMAYCTPDDATQYVAPTFIGWQYAIDNKKGTGTNMVGENPQGIIVQIVRCRDGRGRLNQLLEQVNIIIGMHALHDCRQSFQTHAGVNRGPG